MGYERVSSIVASQIISMTLVDFLTFVIVLITSGHFTIKLLGQFMLILIIQIMVVSSVAVIAVRIHWKVFPPIRLLEVFGDHENDLFIKMNDLPHKYHIAVRIHYLSKKLEEDILNYDAVLINDIPAGARNKLIKLCFEKNRKVYFVPKISDIIIKNAEELNVIDAPLFLSCNRQISRFTQVIKRTFDVVFSLIALILLSPLFLTISLAIKLDDGGPVFFKQERCTIGGKKFTIIKFRSMIVDADKNGEVHPAEYEDMRITKIGKYLRVFRLDELPQFLNILRGDMSVVGPRPERVEHIEKYTQEIPEFCFRNKVKGGLTGYAQVYGKYNTTALDKLKLDLVYIMQYSIPLDIEIMIETIKVLFQKESTEGFSKARVAEMNKIYQQNKSL